MVVLSRLLENVEIDRYLILYVSLLLLQHRGLSDHLYIKLHLNIESSIISIHATNKTLSHSQVFAEILNSLTELFDGIDRKKVAVKMKEAITKRGADGITANIIAE